MSTQLEIGDILEIRPNMRRLVYLGEGKAKCETLLFKGNEDTTGTWKVDEYYPDHAKVILTDQQITFWLTRKAS